MKQASSTAGSHPIGPVFHQSYSITTQSVKPPVCAGRTVMLLTLVLSLSSAKKANRPFCGLKLSHDDANAEFAPKARAPTMTTIRRKKCLRFTSMLLFRSPCLLTAGSRVAARATTAPPDQSNAESRRLRRRLSERHDG